MENMYSSTEILNFVNALFFYKKFIKYLALFSTILGVQQIQYSKVSIA